MRYHCLSNVAAGQNNSCPHAANIPPMLPRCAASARLRARVIAVRPHGTSQTCHQCRSTAPGQRENQAVFRCADPTCGWTGNADTNAAIVIKQRGQEVALQDVEPNATRQATKRQNPKTAA